MKYEERFIVINKKHLKDIPEEEKNLFLTALQKIADYLPNNKYYVCNQDEKYAPLVYSIIEAGEGLKGGRKNVKNI